MILDNNHLQRRAQDFSTPKRGHQPIIWHEYKENWAGGRSKICQDFELVKFERQKQNLKILFEQSSD